jgi:hypothetical protein
MSAAEILYVGGMSLISVGFPSLLVAMWARDRIRPIAAVAKAPPAAAEAPPMRKAA